MSQYHDYILEHMSHSRIKDARRLADADRLVRQSKRLQAREIRPEPERIALIQSLLRHIFGWRIRAHGV